MITENKHLHDLKTFSDEIDKLSAGTVVNGEQAQGFSEVFSRRLIELSRRSELTPEDMYFISEMVDLGARNLVYCLDKGMSPPDQPITDELQRRAVSLSRSAELPIVQPGGAEQPGVEPSSERVISKRLTRMLTPLMGRAISVRRQPFLRAGAEDFAGSAITAFSKMVESNGGQIVLDEYLANNLQSMLAGYEATEPKDSGQE